MQVKDTENNRKNCICQKCPSYPENCLGEILYCAGKKSKCEIYAKGCVCNICKVWHEHKLTGIYFCDKTHAGESKVLMRKKRANESRYNYQKISDIKEISATGKSVVCSMGSLKKIPFSFDDIHFIPAQVHKIPLNKEDKVNTEVIIGSSAEKPLRVSSPIILSGMSFGAVSKNTRSVISQTASKLKIAFNSGEGGILEDELEIASEYMIGQYSTGRFGISEEKLKRVAAVEIRFGQGAYPGKGSYLPAGKITSEIAKARGLNEGDAAYSPAHHSDMKTREEIKKKVAWLHKIGGGIPIGAKIGCGNVEKDMKILVDAGVDFIALDGFGGGTGATDFYIRENVGIPIIAAIPRASRLLKSLGVKEKVTLIAGGNLRSSADFAKCLALGADAVYTGTAALIAINCEQYRICHTGMCPTGITTHSPALVEQLNVEKGVKRLTRFLKGYTSEIANITRIVGKNDINSLDSDDIVSMKKSLAELTGTQWLNGKL